MEAIVKYIKYIDFDSESFVEELKDETSKYFDNPVTCIDETDYEEYEMRLEDDPDEDLGPIRVFCYLESSKQDYFKFTLDDNGIPCMDIKLGDMNWTASLNPNNTDDEIMTQLKNIFKDISTKNIGVHHNNYHLD
tara:strand:+ start:533 stop:937 length:405 start_codon:yes stop_codon:yes gene_type:complete